MWSIAAVCLFAKGFWKHLPHHFKIVPSNCDVCGRLNVPHHDTIVFRAMSQAFCATVDCVLASSVATA